MGGGWLGSSVFLDFLFSEEGNAAVEILNTQEVSCVAPHWDFLLGKESSLSPRRASLYPAALKRAGEERARSSWLATGPLAALGAVRSWGCSVSFLRPTPMSFPPLPSQSPLRPSLFFLWIPWLEYACACSAAEGARAWVRTPFLLTPPAPYLPAVAGPVGSRGDVRTRTRTWRGAQLQTFRRRVRSVGGGDREGGGVCVCVCFTVSLIEGQPEAWKRAKEKQKESESPSARASDLVRVRGQR